MEAKKAWEKKDSRINDLNQFLQSVFGHFFFRIALEIEVEDLY